MTRSFASELGLPEDQAVGDVARELGLSHERALQLEQHALLRYEALEDANGICCICKEDPGSEFLPTRDGERICPQKLWVACSDREEATYQATLRRRLGLRDTRTVTAA